MNIYYLNDMIEDIKLNGDDINELFNAAIYAVSQRNIVSYTEYEKVITEACENLPDTTAKERFNSALVLKLLLINREAVVELCKQKKRVSVKTINNRLVAIIH